MRSSLTALTIGLAALHGTGAIAADYGPWNFLAGPQVAWSWGKKPGVSVGWEGGAGIGAERLNLGQLYWRGGRLTYAVVEPYTLYIGGTLGLGYENNNGLSAVLGLWEGVPVVYPTTCGPERRTDFGFLLTVAVGYRYFSGHHQVYVGPKAGVSQSATSCIVGPGVSGGPM